MNRTRLYRNGVCEAVDFDPEQVSDLLGEPDTLVWLDVIGPPDLGLLEEEFRLHPLAIEDASLSHQRPKVERYTHHLFVVMYATWLDGEKLRTAEVDAFVGDRFLITVRKDPAWPIERVLERWDREEELHKHGVGTLLYGLLDAVVDDCFVVVDRLEEDVEELEERILGPAPDGGLQEELFALRKRLVTLRRVTFPLQEVLSVLLRRDLLYLADDIVPYFRDIHDHLLQIGLGVESMQELLSSAFQVHLSVVSNRLNAIMKKVTSWAAIIGVATLIAGVYGMNFELVPKDQTLTGFLFAVGLMAVSAALLYAYFRRRDWL